MTGEEPPYLTVGTDVSAKYKGAFCEAKIKKVVRSVKCKVNFKNNNGFALVTDDLVRGTLRVGAHVEAKHPEKNQYMEGIINKLHDYSQYTVVFDDGDETTLRRTSLCLKSGRHFAESETLDQLPLTHPEHFGTPVMGIKGGRKRRTLRRSPMLGDASSDDETPSPIARKKEAAKPKEPDPDTGKVVCVDVSDKKKQARDNWFPGLVVSPGAQEAIRIKGKDEYLVRSFKDGKYHVVIKKEAREFTREIGSKVDNNTLKTAVERAMQYVEKDELPPHWDRESLFRAEYSSNDGNSDQDSDSDVSDDEPSEAKDRFVAQLYKFMDDRGTPINKAPLVSNRDLNLYKLFKVVQKSGGYNRVTNQMQWKSVYTKLGLPTANSSASHQIKQAYKKYLHSFEGFERKLGCTMGTSTRSGRVRHRSERNLMVTRDRDREFKTVGRRKKEPKQGPEEKSKPSDVDVKIEISDRSHDETDVGSEKVDDAPTSDKSANDAIPPKKDRPLPKANKEVESKSSDTDDDRKPKGPPRSGDDSKRDESPSTRRRGRKKLIKTEKPDEEDKSQDSDDDDEDSRFDVLISVGDKVRVKYGRGRQQKIYEAKVLKTDTNEDNDRIYFVHYTGWNMRYDEWVKRHRIVENLTQKIPEKRFRQSAGSKFKLGKRGRPHGSYSCSPKLGSGPHSSSGPLKSRGNRRGGSVTRSRTTRSETRNRYALDSPSFPNGLEPQRHRHHGKSSGSSGSESDGESDVDVVVRRTRSAKRDEDADASFEEKDKYEFVDEEDDVEMALKKSEDERGAKSGKLGGGVGGRRVKKDNDGGSTSKSIRKSGLVKERRAGSGDDNEDHDARGEGDGKVKQQLRKLRGKSTKPVEEVIKKVERRGRKKKVLPPQQPPVSDVESEDKDAKDDDDNSQNEGVMDSELYFFESSKKDTTSEAEENSVIEDSESCFVADALAASAVTSKSAGGDVSSETDFTKHEEDSSFIDVASSLFKPLVEGELIVGSESKESQLLGTSCVKEATPIVTCMPSLDKEEPATVELVETTEDKMTSVDDDERDKMELPVEKETLVADKVPLVDVAVAVATEVTTAVTSDAETIKTEDHLVENLSEELKPPPPLDKLAEVEADQDEEKPCEELQVDAAVAVIKDAVVAEDEKPAKEMMPEETSDEKSSLIDEISKLDSVADEVVVEDKQNSIANKPEVTTIADSVVSSVATMLSSTDSSEEDAFQVKGASELLDNIAVVVSRDRLPPPPPPLPPPPPPPPVVLDKFDALLQDIPWRKSSCPTPPEVAGPSASKTDVVVVAAAANKVSSKKEKSRKQKNKKRKASESDTDEDAVEAKKRRSKEDEKKESLATVKTKSSSKKSKEKKKSKKIESNDREEAKKSRRKECKRKKETLERGRGGKDRDEKRVVDSDDASSASSSEVSPIKKKDKKTRKHAETTTTNKKKVGVAKKIKLNEDQHTSDDSKKSLRKEKVKGGKRKEKQEKASNKKDLSNDDSNSLKVTSSATGFEPIEDGGKQQVETKSETGVVTENSAECNVPSYLICEEDVPASPVGTPDVDAASAVEFPIAESADVKTATATAVAVPSTSVVVTSAAASPPPRMSAFTLVTQKQSVNDSLVAMDSTTTSESAEAMPADNRDKAASPLPPSPIRATDTTMSTAKFGQQRSSSLSGSSDDTTVVVHGEDVAQSGGGDDDVDRKDGTDKTSASSSKRSKVDAVTAATTATIVAASAAAAAAASEDAAPTTKRRRRNYKKQPISEAVVEPPPRRVNSPGLSSRHRPTINKPLRSSENEEFAHMADMFLGVANSTLAHHPTHGDVHTRMFSTATLAATPPSASSAAAPASASPHLSSAPPSAALPLQPQLLPPVLHSPTKPSKFNFYTELDDFLDGSERIAVLQDRLTELRRTYLSLKADLACIDRRRKKLKRKEKEGK